LIGCKVSANVAVRTGKRPRSVSITAFLFIVGVSFVRPSQVSQDEPAVEVARCVAAVEVAPRVAAAVPAWAVEEARCAAAAFPVSAAEEEAQPAAAALPVSLAAE
jgi:hypothetical protein